VAIGVPGDSVDGQNDAGAVNVIYGRAGGLHEAGDQLWTQNTDGVNGLAGSGHRFGAALAGGDLSRNGRDELAIGIPGGFIGGDAEAGAVSVLYGRSGGLTSVDDLWSQDARGIKGIAERSDRFGAALAIGDFDGDRAGDLAIGVPDDSVGNAAGAGAVNVLYGADTGLRGVGDQLWTQDAPGILSRASIGETFGSALVASDFSRNGADDLAIGVPRQGVSGGVNAGAVSVLYGSVPPACARSPTSCGRRTRPASRAAPSATTCWARRSPPATSTATATTTWRSASRATASPASPPPAPSTYSTAPSAD